MASCEYGDVCPFETLLWERASQKAERYQLWREIVEGPDSLKFVESLMAQARSYTATIEALENTMRKIRPCPECEYDNLEFSPAPDTK